MNPIVIIGSGMAGYTLLREFRKRDAHTPVTLVTADDGHVYSKPNLSNALAQRRAPEQLASETAKQAAAKYGAEVLTHTRVTAIDAVKLARLTVRLSSSSGPVYWAADRASCRRVISRVVPGSQATAPASRLINVGKNRTRNSPNEKQNRTGTRNSSGLAKGSLPWPNRLMLPCWLSWYQPYAGGSNRNKSR